jgi:hypothetical protein
VKLQNRTIIEWEFDTETQQQRITKQWTMPSSGYKKKPKEEPVKVVEAQSTQSGTEEW